MLTKAYISTPIGTFEMISSDLGIRQLHLVDEREEAIPEELSAAAAQLKEYFDKKRTTFDVKLDWSGASEFYVEVWKELLKVPYGRTTTYSAIAEKLENPRAVRAVGLANKYNPIAIIVPCHRVIAKSGDLQGYFYGVDVKRKLLELENPMSFAQQGSLF